MRNMQNIPRIRDRELELLTRRLYGGKIDTHMYNHDFGKKNSSTVDFRYVPFNVATKEGLKKKVGDFRNFESGYLNAAIRWSEIITARRGKYSHITVTVKTNGVTHFIRRGRIIHVYMRDKSSVIFGPQVGIEGEAVRLPVSMEDALEYATDLDRLEPKKSI